MEPHVEVLEYNFDRPIKPTNQDDHPIQIDEKQQFACFEC